jgi:hypothetical protein
MEVRLGPLWKEGEAGTRSLVTTRESKRLFFLLSSLSLAFLFALLWLLFYLLEPRVSTLGGRFTAGMAVAFGVLGAALAALVAADFLAAAAGVRVARSPAGRALIRRLLLPISEGVGRIFRMSTDRVKGSFIEFNNAVVRANAGSVVNAGAPTRAAAEVSAALSGSPAKPAEGVRVGASEQVLLLLPHCLQNSECTRMLAGDVQNCGECGSCVMNELKELVLRYGVQNRIVGGGALALMAVRELRPKAVAGVACERELVAAIRELGDIPVMAISNCRPEGPCRNTVVEIARVEEALRILLKH